MKERLEGVLTVKVPVEWLELLDRLSDPDEEENGRRSRVTRKIIRKALVREGLLTASPQRRQRR